MESFGQVPSTQNLNCRHLAPLFADQLLLNQQGRGQLGPGSKSLFQHRQVNHHRLSLEGAEAVASQFGELLDLITELRPHFVTSAGFLPLSATTRCLTTLTATTNLAGFPMGRLSF